jgi:YD repeat-containing protein
VTSENTNTLNWDGSGRLSGGTFAGTGITYTYGPDGALMSRITSSPATTRNYLLGDLFETDGTGTVTMSYADGSSGDCGSYAGAPAPGATVSYLYYSSRADVTAETDVTGTTTATQSYDPLPSGRCRVHHFNRLFGPPR